MKSTAGVAKSYKPIRSVTEAQERLHLAMQIGRMYAFEWIPGTDTVLRSGDAELIAGLWGTSRDTGNHILSKLHPEDHGPYHRVACELTKDRPSYEISYRFIHGNGSVIWLHEIGQAFYDAKGKLLRVIGVTADITKSKQAEESLRQMGGRLLSAQEEERQRIARELHDDIGQDLAVLLVRAHKAIECCSKPALLDQLKQLQTGARQISTKVSRLSHQLHASELDFIGLGTALEMLSRDFSQSAALELTCRCKDIPLTLDRNLSVAFYRVAQEALHNIVKHAAATHVSVELHSKGKHLVLRVKDDGCGLETNSRPTGLGLISMRERMHLVGGTLTIFSRPGQGTTIEARARITTPRVAPVSPLL